MEGPIKEFMTKAVVCIPVDIDFLDACKKFTEYGIHHLPVVDNTNKLIGMFSSTDAIYAINTLLQGEKLTSGNVNNRIKIKDVMTHKNIEFLEPEDPIGDAIILLQRANFNSIPILENDKIVGIVTSHDLFKAFRKELG